MNKAATFLLLVCFAVSSAFEAVAGQTEPPVVPAADTELYGQYPIESKEIITRWLDTKLVDPRSAVIEWAEPPKPGEYKTRKDERYVGYLVDFKVNARNQFGGPTGKQKYRVVIKNGDVLWGGHPRY
jgi:hypothetical protein